MVQGRGSAPCNCGIGKLLRNALSEAIDPNTAAALGIVQGLTEFLPVSSSGHVSIGAALLGIESDSLTLTILLHLGTLLATLLLFRLDVGKLISEALRSLTSPALLRETSEGRTIIAIAIATVITGAIGLALRPLAERVALDPHLVGWGFLISAGCLAATFRVRGNREEISSIQAALVGLAQGMAVLPGISRSGVTIGVALLLGVRGDEAFRFSFLASLPVIIAAAGLEAVSADGLVELGTGAWVGGVVALATGYLALLVLRRIVLVGRMWLFALYLAPLGVFLIVR